MQWTTGGLLGREREIGRLVEVVEGAARGRGGFLLLHGDAGLGKTALLDEAVRRVEPGIGVLRSHGDPIEVDVPFAAIRWIDGLEGDASPRIESIVDDVLDRAVARPVVVVADDLQWMDPSSLRIIASLGRRASQLSLAVVAACRSAVDRADVVAVLRNAERLPVGPLGLADARQLARRLLNDPPIESSDAAATQIVATAAGSPFWIERLCVAAGSSDSLIADSAPSAVVLAPLNSLSDGQRDILVVAALIGTEVDPEQVSELHGASPVEVLQVLRAAESAGLVEATPSWSFSHDLVRDALAALVPRQRQDAIHRTIAEGLDGTRPIHAVGFLSRVTDLDGAGESLLRAAQVTAQTSIVEAATLAQRGWEALPLEHPLRPTAAADVVGILASAGRAADAIELCSNVLDRALDDELEARLRVALSAAADQMNRPADALGFIQDAQHLHGLSDRVDALVHAWLGRARLWVGNLDGAVAACDHADTRHDASGAATAIVAATRSLVAGARGHATDAVRAANIEADRANDRHGQLVPDSLHDPNGVEVILAARLMDIDDMDGSAAQFQRQIDATGINTITRHTTCLLGLAANRYLRGDIQDAVAMAHAAESAARDAGAELHFPLARGLESYLAFQLGDFDTARSTRDTGWAAALGPGTNAGIDVLLKVDLLLAEVDDQVADCVDRIEALWAIAAPMAYLAAWKTVAPSAVRLAASIGHPMAGQLTDLAVVGGHRAPGIATAEATALRCRGLSAGDRELLAEAAETYRRGPRPIDELECRLEAADHDVADGQESPARVHLERALELARLHRLPLSEQMAIERLNRIGVRKRRTVSASQTGWRALTDTELAVVELVAEGMTNRAIGDHLFMSPRTVETHLNHVFRKLGLGSRIEVATAFTTHNAPAERHDAVRRVKATSTTLLRE